MSRLILSHNSKKNSFFGDMLMSKTLSKSQLCPSHFLSHHSMSNVWDIIMSKSISKSSQF